MGDDICTNFNSNLNSNFTPQQAAKSSTKFPARLESPPGKKSAGAASGASSKPKAKKNDGGGGGGKRTKWTFEEEEA